MPLRSCRLSVVVVVVVVVLALMHFAPVAASPAAAAGAHGRSRTTSPASEAALSLGGDEAAHYPHLRSLDSGVAHDNVRVDLKTDCAIKELALEFAQKLQPLASVTSLVSSALQLGTICGVPLESPEAEKYSTYFSDTLRWRSTPQHAATEITLFVDGVGGSDSNPGTQGLPLASLQQALLLIRSSRPQTGSSVASLASQAATVYFRAGYYFFPDSIVLGPRDSFLTLSAFNGEEVVFSGGADLSSLEFSVFSGEVLVATLGEDTKIASEQLNELYGRPGGRRSTRARFPNGNAETQGLYTANNTGYLARPTTWLPPIPPATKPIDIIAASPVRPSGEFPAYQWGVGGAAAVFDPPSSFWATTNPPAGITFAVPSGFIYDPATYGNKTYADPSTALIHTFHGMYWGGWTYSVGDIDPVKHAIYFSRGGFQESRGSIAGAEWYIDNVLEELDAPEEWWVDSVNGLLYYYPNSTADWRTNTDGTISPPTNGSLIATQSPIILSVQGSSPNDLVEGIVLQGLTFSHSSTTMMQTMEVPSGGDWTITRTGAVRLENVKNTTIFECVFNGIGGNALVLSRTALNTTIVANEFAWIGSSAILVAGVTAGLDGSGAVTYPLGTIIESNMFREIGIWVKQSSAVGQSLAQATTIIGNIGFNIARAALNFNDGFGGGHTVTSNLLFNTVRETDDHGPINSWDRGLYLMRNADGNIGFQPDLSEISLNFLLGNYHSVWPIDHDDGSRFWYDHDNYVVYGGYKSYLGDSLTVINNAYVLPDGKVDSQAELERAQQADAGSLESQRFDSLSGILQSRPRNMGQRYKRREVVNSGVDSMSYVATPESASVSRNWGQFCCQDGGGFGHLFVNNSCAPLEVANLYNFFYCDPHNLASTVPFLAANSYFVSGVINITCQTVSYDFAQWQKLGYDLETQQEAPASLQLMLQWGQQILGLGAFADADEREQAF